jgi:hypothetical protein
MAVPPAPTQGVSMFDWGVKEAAKQRKQAGTKRSRTKADSSGGGGSSGGARKPRATKASKASAAAAATAAGNESVPLCPGHHEPFRVGTSNTAKNPDRVFYKCARDEGQQCVTFAWAEDFAGGSGGAAAAAGPSSRGGSSSRGGRGGTRGKGRGKAAAAGASSRGGAAAGSWGGGGGGGGFVSVTGAPMNVCHKCQQPGHWAASCPNA